MPKLTFLGTSNAVPDVDHENTHMVIEGGERTILIDGAGNPFVRLKKAGVDNRNLTDVIMTHFHPDHVSGIPALLMGMGLSKRKKNLNLYANNHCMVFMKQLLDNFEWETWHFFPVKMFTISDNQMELLIDCDDFKIFTTPVKHFIPTIGLRIEFKKSGKILAYSCDTAPTASLESLCKDADVLIHEAAGASIGHSSAFQAGQMAKKSNAKELYLIHYPTGEYDYKKLVDEAKQAYEGPVTMAEDFMTIDF